MPEGLNDFVGAAFMVVAFRALLAVVMQRDDEPEGSATWASFILGAALMLAVSFALLETSLKYDVDATFVSTVFWFLYVPAALGFFTARLVLRRSGNLGQATPSRVRRPARAFRPDKNRILVVEEDDS
jgi:apolipoprotein N-acyltransferase